MHGKKHEKNVARAYERCLDAPNYTVFSNTTSAAQWNTNLPVGTRVVMPLEQPHNDIHLAVGGYDVPSGPNQGDFSPIEGANGDMGENDTAGLDPIFYFHHWKPDGDNLVQFPFFWRFRDGESTDTVVPLPLPLIWSKNGSKRVVTPSEENSSRQEKPSRSPDYGGLRVCPYKSLPCRLTSQLFARRKIDNIGRVWIALEASSPAFLFNSNQ